MTLDEKIQQYVRKLPRSLQEELLDYVEFLVMKAEQQERQDWSSLSLSSALRGMGDEQISYSSADLKETFG
jgi:hypothetical protein